jgi:outer membrane lipoprotein SlyB
MLFSTCPVREYRRFRRCEFARSDRESRMDLNGSREVRVLKRSVVSLIVAVAVLGVPVAEAQRSGQNASISIGVVKKVENINLQSQVAPAGALMGGMLAYKSTGSSRSSTTKWGRAAAGAVAGGAIARAAEGDLSGKVYTVDLGGGRMIQVVSDQTEIRQGDCVIVEEVKGQANVRRADPAACQPESASVIASADVQEELQEEAAECVAAKEALLAAETEEQFDLAQRKMAIFCND